MRCADCRKILKVGDRYIEDVPSGFMNVESDIQIDEIMSEVLGGSDGKIYYCEDCTIPGGTYHFITVSGDED